MSSSSSGPIKRVLALDWDPRSLRVVDAQLGKRGMRIEKVFSAAHPPDLDTSDPKQLGKHISDVLDQEGVGTRTVIVDIPRDQAILNTLSLPVASMADLPGMVEIQVAKELPFPVVEAAVDFIVPPMESWATKADVLVAAVRRDVLDHYVSVCEEAGLKLHRIGLRPHANNMALNALYEDTMPERLLFVDLRPTLTEIDVLRNGHLEFSRAASVHIPHTFEERPLLSLAGREEDDAEEGSGRRGSAPAHGAEAVVRSLLLEVTRSLEAYRAREQSAQIDQVVIGGEFGIEERLAELITERMEIPAETYNPAKCFGWSPEQGAAASGYAAALGLVLGEADHDRQRFDFLHPKRMVSKTRQKLRKAPIAAAVAVLFIGAAVVVVEGTTRPDRKLLARLEKDIKALEDKQAENKKFIKIVEEVRAFDEQHVWVDVLYDLVEALPGHESLVIDQLGMEQKDGRVTLKTRGKSRDTGSVAVQALESYRRKGCSRPRFQATMGPQSEDPRDKYPFEQEVTVLILDDGFEKIREADQPDKG